ncbi:GL21367 [Drosophila persimilis]|uniref:GL21367 n=1 Tax=Drosophila persimilis TaxID=7234 RepID=B4ISA1_DROPE|nr:GL21367 [Drosophila persimilis]
MKNIYYFGRCIFESLEPAACYKTLLGQIEFSISGRLPRGMVVGWGGVGWCGVAQECTPHITQATPDICCTIPSEGAAKKQPHTDRSTDTETATWGM